MKTYMAKPAEMESKWYLVDAADKTLGRLASEVAKLLIGKHKPTYTPHIVSGDHVVVINAEKIVLTGKKLEQKNYYRHSGYPGGLKSINYSDLMQRSPEKAVMLAVRGMLPKNKLGSKMLKKLRVYRGEEHPHPAQKPETIEIKA